MITGQGSYGNVCGRRSRCQLQLMAERLHRMGAASGSLPMRLPAAPVAMHIPKFKLETIATGRSSKAALTEVLLPGFARERGEITASNQESKSLGFDRLLVYQMKHSRDRKASCTCCNQHIPQRRDSQQKDQYASERKDRTREIPVHRQPMRPKPRLSPRLEPWGR